MKTVLVSVSPLSAQYQKSSSSRLSLFSSIRKGFQFPSLSFQFKAETVSRKQPELNLGILKLVKNFVYFMGTSAIGFVSDENKAYALMTDLLRRKLMSG
jgi:hypothetical protein